LTERVTVGTEIVELILEALRHYERRLLEIRADRSFIGSYGEPLLEDLDHELDLIAKLVEQFSAYGVDRSLPLSEEHSRVLRSALDQEKEDLSAVEQHVRGRVAHAKIDWMKAREKRALIDGILQIKDLFAK